MKQLKTLNKWVMKDNTLFDLICLSRFGIWEEMKEDTDVLNDSNHNHKY